MPGFTEVGIVYSKATEAKKHIRNYLELVYLVTALVPSDTACFASSPGNKRRTAVWISLEVMVDLHTRF